MHRSDDASLLHRSAPAADFAVRGEWPAIRRPRRALSPRAMAGMLLVVTGTAFLLPLTGCNVAPHDTEGDSVKCGCELPVDLQQPKPGLTVDPSLAALLGRDIEAELAAESSADGSGPSGFAADDDEVSAGWYGSAGLGGASTAAAVAATTASGATGTVAGTVSRQQTPSWSQAGRPGVQYDRGGGAAEGFSGAVSIGGGTPRYAYGAEAYRITGAGGGSTELDLIYSGLTPSGDAAWYVHDPAGHLSSRQGVDASNGSANAPAHGGGGVWTGPAYDDDGFCHPYPPDGFSGHISIGGGPIGWCDPWGSPFGPGSGNGTWNTWRTPTPGRADWWGNPGCGQPDWGDHVPGSFSTYYPSGYYPGGGWCPTPPRPPHCGDEDGLFIQLRYRD